MMMVMGVPPNKVLTMQTKAAHGYYGLALGSHLSLVFFFAAVWSDMDKLSKVSFLDDNNISAIVISPSLVNR